MSMRAPPTMKYDSISLSERQRPEVGKPLPINNLSQQPAFPCLCLSWPELKTTKTTTFMPGKKKQKTEEKKVKKVVQVKK